MTFNSRDAGADSAKINGSDKNPDDSAAKAYQHFRTEISQYSSAHNSADTAKFLQAVTKNLIANNILPDCVIADAAPGAATGVKEKGRESGEKDKEQSSHEKQKEDHESNSGTRDKHQSDEKQKDDPESNAEKPRHKSDSSKEHEHHSDHETSKPRSKHHSGGHHKSSHRAPNLVLDSSSGSDTATSTPGAGSDIPAPSSSSSGAGSDTSTNTRTGAETAISTGSSGAASDTSISKTTGAETAISAGSSGAGADTSKSPPASGADAPNSVSPAGNYRVENGVIYDPSGKQFVPNGIDLNTSQGMNNASTLVNQDKFNFFRFDDNLVNSDGGPNFKVMDALVQKFKNTGNGKSVLEFEYPDWQLGGSEPVLTGSNLTNAKAWYTAVAAHYKDEPQVWLATTNESGSSNSNAWIAQQEGILGAVEKGGNNNPVVVGDTNWGQAGVDGNPTSNSSVYKDAADFKKIDPNLIAGEHVYNSSPNAASELSAGIAAMKSAGLATVIQEFGPFNFGNPKSDGPGVDAVLSQATADQGVGYVGYTDAQGLTGASYTQMAGSQGQDALINQDGSLSQFGQKILAQNKSDQLQYNDAG